MRRFAGLVFALAGALSAVDAASAGRFAVGLKPSASLQAVAADVRAVTGARIEIDAGLRAVFVDADRARPLRRLPGVAYVEALTSRRRLAFTPNDPLLPRQWYVSQIRAFDFWPQAPTLPGVKVAVIDSGIDGRHPELARRIAAAKSFVGGSAHVDRQGHGTFVAGEIAAATGNGQGIAGIAFPAQLVIAKVVRGEDRQIPLEAEARAIRWAVDQGAKVINLSFSGVRDPHNARRDSFSALEASAVAYAHKKGALVVAAVGNGDQAPETPWEYAGWPAALPHVLSVSAFARDGSVPRFSNRDEFYNDIAAPGEDILSTLPRSITAARPSCTSQGYSECGPSEYRRAEGTSFAAPQVSAAAALLLSVKPMLRAEQLSYLLTRTAVDATAVNGCRSCSAGHDELTGWGRLDIVRALLQTVYSQPPDPDRYETNDDAGNQAWRLWGPAARQFTATLDFWDDQIDVYSIKLARGQRLRATVRGPFGAEAKLLLWKPGTKRVEGFRAQSGRVATSTRVGATEYIRNYTAAAGGWYYLEVKLLEPGSGQYTLSYTKLKTR